MLDLDVSIVGFFCVCNFSSFVRGLGFFGGGVSLGVGFGEKSIHSGLSVRVSHSFVLFCFMPLHGFSLMRASSLRPLAFFLAAKL